MYTTICMNQTCSPLHLHLIASHRHWSTMAVTSEILILWHCNLYVGASCVTQNNKQMYKGDAKSSSKVEWTGAPYSGLYASSIYITHGWLELRHIRPAVFSSIYVLGSSISVALCIQPKIWRARSFYLTRWLWVALLLIETAMIRQKFSLKLFLRICNDKADGCNIKAIFC